MTQTGRMPRRRADPKTVAQAIVLRRRDFRESSRLVTCLTREHGKITALAKGAHRPDSPLLGRIDFLNELDASFSPDRGGLRILLRAKLTRERRALRSPWRYLSAGHIAWLCDVASQEGRSDPELFDLLSGGLNLLERCPEAKIPQVVLGLELRHLDAVGALPDFDSCTQCGDDLSNEAFRQTDTMGLACRRHSGLPRIPVLWEALQTLRTLRSTSGRDWPSLHLGTSVHAAASLPALWLAAALEQRSPYRRMVFEGLAMRASDCQGV